jgi:hypothetical protein
MAEELHSISSKFQSLDALATSLGHRLKALEQYYGVTQKRSSIAADEDERLSFISQQSHQILKDIPLKFIENISIDLIREAIR